MGSNGYKSLVDEREKAFVYLREKMTETAAKFGQVVLKTPQNGISLGIRLISNNP
jgi:hypothetical protein